MKVSATESTTKFVDRNGVAIFTVKLDEPCFFDTDNTREKARAALEQTLGNPVGKSSRIQPIRNWTGRLIAYAIWKEK
jgi:3'-phosphoadenosine 5'-phosphosulfate sulfotransferase (PAPS reductase)/FAD synthetase